MIQLAGLEPDMDIPIVFTQPYPGEKLFEDILTAEEGTSATKHCRIYIAKTNNGAKAGESLKEALEDLKTLGIQGDGHTIVEALRKLVPGYSPTNGMYGRPLSMQSLASLPKRWRHDIIPSNRILCRFMKARRSADHCV